MRRTRTTITILATLGILVMPAGHAHAQACIGTAAGRDAVVAVGSTLSLDEVDEPLVGELGVAGVGGELGLRGPGPTGLQARFRKRSVVDASDETVLDGTVAADLTGGDATLCIAGGAGWSARDLGPEAGSGEVTTVEVPAGLGISAGRQIAPEARVSAFLVPQVVWSRATVGVDGTSAPAGAPAEEEGASAGTVTTDVSGRARAGILFAGARTWIRLSSTVDLPTGETPAFRPVVALSLGVTF
jgi:hypothetical protein